MKEKNYVVTEAQLRDLTEGRNLFDQLMEFGLEDKWSQGFESLNWEKCNDWRTLFAEYKEAGEDTFTKEELEDLSTCVNEWLEGEFEPYGSKERKRVEALQTKLMTALFPNREEQKRGTK